MTNAEARIAPASSELGQIPLATINGQAVIDLPKDLYIPPDAMKVFLEAFEGPLDFLLYLIRKQNIDVLDIPIASVTRQYMEYIDLMQALSLELASEYLVMAAILAEIKSRMLVPRHTEDEQTEHDPRIELVQRLQEYERFRQSADDLDKLPREERDIFPIKIDSSQIIVERKFPQPNLQDVLNAFKEVLKRTELHAHHHIQMESLSVREKMSYILKNLQQNEHVLFTNFFNILEGRLGLVVTFLAMLELLKQNLIEFIQAGVFAPIYLQPKQKLK